MITIDRERGTAGHESGARWFCRTCGGQVLSCRWKQPGLAVDQGRIDFSNGPGTARDRRLQPACGALAMSSQQLDHGERPPVLGAAPRFGPKAEERFLGLNRP